MGVLTIKRRSLMFVFAASTAFFVLAMIAARAASLGGLVYPFTVPASTGFVLTAMAGGALHSSYGRLMGLGLIGCCVGDLVGPYHFIGGAMCFFMAHLWFIAAYATRGLQWRNMIRPFAGMLVVGVGIVLWLMPHVPAAETQLVLAYMVVIAGMVVLAFGAKIKNGRPFVLTGGVLFFVSDIFVARWKYVSSDGINAFLCYPLYYTACILLALSIAMCGNSATEPEYEPVSERG